MANKRKFSSEGLALTVDADSSIDILADDDDSANGKNGNNDDNEHNAESDFSSKGKPVAATPDEDFHDHDIVLNTRVRVEAVPLISKSKRKATATTTTAAAATESADGFMSARGSNPAAAAAAAARPKRVSTRVIGDVGDVFGVPRSTNRVQRLQRVELAFGDGDSRVGEVLVHDDRLELSIGAGAANHALVVPLKDVAFVIRVSSFVYLFVDANVSLSQLNLFGPLPSYDRKSKSSRTRSIQLALMTPENTKLFDDVIRYHGALREAVNAGLRKLTSGDPLYTDAALQRPVKRANAKQAIGVPMRAPSSVPQARRFASLNPAAMPTIPPLVPPQPQPQAPPPSSSANHNRLLATSRLRGSVPQLTRKPASPAKPRPPIDLAGDDSDESAVRVSKRGKASKKRPRTRSVAAESSGDGDDSASARPLLVYPPPPNDANAVTVTTRDLQRLRPGEYLNDTLIEFYLRYLLVHMLAPAQRERIHVFNTFFFDKLTSGHRNEDRYAEVSRWTKNVDLFAKDFVIIPINENAHWYMIVACFIGQLCDDAPPPNVSQGDDDGAAAAAAAASAASQQSSAGADEPPSRLARTPCLLKFDSLGGGPGTNQSFRVIRDYFARELLDKRPGTLANNEVQLRFSAEKFAGITVSAPEQDNVFDCGLFLLHYAELLCMHADEIFSDATTPRATAPQLKKIFERRRERFWFDQARITAKRRELTLLISSLGQARAPVGSLSTDQSVPVAIDDDDDDDDDSSVDSQRAATASLPVEDD